MLPNFNDIPTQRARDPYEYTRPQDAGIYRSEGVDASYSRDITPWHTLGTVGTIDETVLDVADRLPIPDARMQPLSARVGRKYLRSDYQQVMVTQPDGRSKLMGRPVEKDWTLISHRDAVELFAANVRDLDGKLPPIETMGLLGSWGERMFITVKLPDFSVRGDEMQSFLMLHNVLLPGRVAEGIETDVRVVCRNTCRNALANAQQRIAVQHNAGAIAQFAKALAEMYTLRVQSQSIIREAYDVLAGAKLDRMDVLWVAESVYRMPNAPDTSRVTKATLAERQRDYDRRVAQIDQLRRGMMAAFDGAIPDAVPQTGALAGTAWAGYQALTWQETHRPGDIDVVAKDLIDGDRAQRIRAGNALFMALATPANWGTYMDLARTISPGIR